MVTGFSVAVTLMTALLAGTARTQVALAPAAPSAGLSAAAPPAGLTAVPGRNTGDSTAAMQALANYARDNGHPPVLLPTGLVRLTAPLVVGNTPASYTGAPLQDVEQGWCLQGSGPPAIQPGIPGAGGSCLYQTAANQAAVLQLGPGGARRSQLTNVGLLGYGGSRRTAASTRYGVWNGGYTHWSAVTLRGVLIQNVGTGIAITGPADGSGSQGRNGEELDCYDCQIDAYNTVYLNSTSSGQSKPESWYGTQATTSVPGGTAYIFGGTGPYQLGGNFSNFGSSLSMGHERVLSAASAFNTFIQDYGAENICFVGGRDEGVGTLVSWVGSGPSATGCVAISGHTFAGMNGYAPFLKSSGSGHDLYRILLTGDSFTSYAATPLTLGIAPHSTASVVLTDCDFDGWTDYSALTTSPRLTLVRCRARTKPTEPYAPLISGAAPTAHLDGPARKAPLPGLRAAAKPRLRNIAEISLFAAPIAGCVLFFLTRSVGRTSS